jgi:DNA (cytosine-5)-methyltransferase 1
VFRVLDLFSGIGGFSLGLERTGGFRTVAFCEIDPYCRRVLAKHWPEVRRYVDVRELTADALRRDGIAVDVICGGFPCQDISFAGKGAGLDGERSGLWREYTRLIGELRPSYAIVENVSALLNRGLDGVLGNLASFGYDAEWHCIPACAVGAPHRRDRLWLIGYPNDEGQPTLSINDEAPRLPPLASYAVGGRWGEGHQNARGGCSRKRTAKERLGLTEFRWWQAEPNVGRVAHGVPARMDRLKALGNAVVPQIPELIGRAILAELIGRAILAAA